MAMQIKRGSETLNPTTADSHILEDGQLFYSKFNNQTYIGDNGKPISELKPKISSWLEPGEGNGAIQSTHKYLAESYHGEDYSNEAKGSGSLALGGYGNKALGTRSVALQNQSKSLGNTSFTAGQANKNWANCALVFGNGNIAGIESYDENGKPTIPIKVIAGTKEADSGNLSQHSVVFGAANKLISASKSIIAGSDNIVQEVPDSNGAYQWKTIGDAIFGRSNQLTNTTDSLVAGSGNIIDGTKVINTDSGSPYGAFYNVVGGKGNKVNSNYSAAFGLSNTIEHTNSNYGHSFVVGAYNYTSAGMTFLLGRGLYSTNGGQTVVGKYNEYYNNNSLFIVGNGSDNNNRSNAFEVKQDGSAIFSGEITSPTVTTITSNIQSLNSGKANKATTLSGYGITDAYTKTDIDTKDTNTLTSANNYTDTALSALDGTYKNHNAYRTVDTISQTNGKVNVSYKDIAIKKNHITDLVVYGEIEGNSNLAKEVITLRYPQPQAVYILIATKFVNPITSSEVEKVSHKVFTLSDVTSLTSVDGNSIQYIKSENKLEIIGNPGAGMDMGGGWVTYTQLKLITL